MVCYQHSDLTTVVAALESTSFYSIHIANYLSSCEELMRFKAIVVHLHSRCFFKIALQKEHPPAQSLVGAFLLSAHCSSGEIENEKVGESKQTEASPALC